MNSHEKRNAQVGDLGGADDNATMLPGPIVPQPVLPVKPLIARDLDALRRALADVAVISDDDHAQRLERVYSQAVQVARLGGVT